ncbi:MULTISPECIES: ATP-binding protein [unclassified Streptomyces]|uniref:ATP-binding protein n=1 Tax=unclassified Streptomyces TaxID=2593676 RepID=UPI000DC4F84C|nr:MULTISPECIES: ATP-binding protein [unclassified Streptomyces]MYT73731.1 ATP-binding protein [Streptomyces sp. SID8367]RAJ85272.1 anti-sigma regulatory factor (Ser/Thr protein kinase) [Streptomyces sp. PsTaAH-137]
MRAFTDAQGRTARVEYLMPQGAGAPRLARRLTRSFLAGCTDDTAADAELVVTELVTNATRASDSHCRMSLRIDADELTVAVHDDGPGLPRLRPPSQSAESGRGITLVRALSRRWSVEPHPQGGKTVRAVLAPC